MLRYWKIYFEKSCLCKYFNININIFLNEFLSPPPPPPKLTPIKSTKSWNFFIFSNWRLTLDHRGWTFPFMINIVWRWWQLIFYNTISYGRKNLKFAAISLRVCDTKKKSLLFQPTWCSWNPFNWVTNNEITASTLWLLCEQEDSVNTIVALKNRIGSTPYSVTLLFVSYYAIRKINYRIGIIDIDSYNGKGHPLWSRVKRQIKYVQMLWGLALYFLITCIGTE